MKREVNSDSLNTPIPDYSLTTDCSREEHKLGVAIYSREALADVITAIDILISCHELTFEAAIVPMQTAKKKNIYILGIYRLPHGNSALN